MYINHFATAARRNACREPRCLLSFVLQQVDNSSPYVITVTTHELNSPSLVWLPNDCDLRTCVSLLHSFDAKAIQAIISDLTSPFIVHLLSKYGEFWTVSSTPPFNCIGSSVSEKFITIFFDILIWRSIYSEMIWRFSIFSCASLCVQLNSAMWPAKSSSCRLLPSTHLAECFLCSYALRNRLWFQ